jgi:cation diffusion facilitator CzcD-associated flavoprotein CzcO
MTDTAASPTSFDPDALRDRYRSERDKRLRADGNDQYVEMAGAFAHYLDDPYISFDGRPPRQLDVHVAVVGGGFGGMLVGARLREAGIDDFVVIEKGGDFGGTWYWNRYPGAACDVESYIYLPLLEELGFVPASKYTPAPEILAHSRRIAEHYGLYERSLLQTEVTDARWDEHERRWVVSTGRGDTVRARFLCMANGPLHRPKLPGIDGVGTFGGHSFHTSRWDYAYTGGSSDGDLTGLTDKVVGIIGTGATAVQCVPHLGRAAKHLYVFQRTPSSIDVRNDRRTDPTWAASLQPGWQRRRQENFTNLTSGAFDTEDLVADGWTEIIANLLLRARQGGLGSDPVELAKVVEVADFEKMNQIRARVDATIEDPGTAEALKPWYRQFCKRPCFHDDYLPTFNRPNVTLVDTDGKGVERITPRGVVANGVEFELDCLIYATGFEVGTDFTRRSGYEVHGVDGGTLTEKWADGARTFHGFFSRGFPNCFIISTAQSGFSVNFPHMLNEQAIHVAHVVRRLTDDGITRVEAEQRAEDDWVELIVANSTMNLAFLEACTPGYYNNEGRPLARAAQNGSYGKGPVAFARLLEQWRAAGDLAGLELAR